MSKPEWGQKHSCQKCVKPFYDMNKPIAKCPICKQETHDLSFEDKADMIETVQPNTNDNNIQVGQISDEIPEFDAEEALGLDFEAEVGLEIEEYFEEDFDEVVDLAQNPYQDRIS